MCSFNARRGRSDGRMVALAECGLPRPWLYWTRMTPAALALPKMWLWGKWCCEKGAQAEQEMRSL